MYVTRVAATAVKFANRMSAPLTKPTPIAQANITPNPRAQAAPERLSRMKNEPTTTRNPASGPTQRSMPPSKSANVLTEGNEAKGRAREHHRRDVEVGEVPIVLRPDVGAERDHDRCENEDWRIVALDETRDGRTPRRRRSCCETWVEALTAAWTMRSSVTSSPSKVATAWPRDITTTRSQSPPAPACRLRR